MQTTTFWGLGAKDWAELQEPQHLPLYERILDALALPPGSDTLDAGCGSGLLAWLATQRGLNVTGLDASPMFLEAARRRSPSSTFLVGDLRALPFEAASFDAVIGCNSFQFLPDPVDAVREAARVLRPGGRLAIAAFDAPGKCEAAAPIAAIMSLLPAATGGPGPFSLSTPGTLEAILRDGGLAPEPDGLHKIDTPWTYPDCETATRAFLSAGPAHQASSLVGTENVRNAIDAALAKYRQPDGTYLLQNVFTFIVGRKP